MSAIETKREYNRLKRKELVGMKHKGIVPYERIDVAELRRLQAQIPEDTRDLTAFLCGDPLPGRRAIDQRP